MHVTKTILSVLFLVASIIPSAGEVTSYVDPFIGTTNFSVCNPGAILPHGMMSVCPFNVMGSDLNQQDKDSRWWSAPYEWNNKYFTGFAHVTLSGVGCPEVGTLLLMPTTGKLDADYHNYGSEYKDEKARPGYYSNRLTKYNILSEVTATTRSSIERFTFPKGESHLLMNIGKGLTNESGGWLRRVSDTEIEGMRLCGTFCYNPQAVFPIYFVMRVSKAPRSAGFWKMQPVMTGAQKQWDSDNGHYKYYTDYGREMGGDDIGYFFTYDTQEGEQIEVKIGVSFVSTANARENLDKEQQGWDFDRVAAEALNTWEQTLSCVSVEGGTEEQRRVFYTALYHSQIHPTILQDVNGDYPLRGALGTGHTTSTRYTIFSLWDTYRNLHQLETLLYPQQQLDMVRSMVDMYKESGWTPRWELFGRETWVMEGDPAIPVVTDTYLKGLRDFDVNAIYEGFVKTATTPGKDNKMRPDIDGYLKLGYVPFGVYAGDMSGDNSVSHALEYYVADNALSRLASALGHKEDARRFLKQSLRYKTYFSKEYGVLRPRKADGSFITPFNPDDGANFSNAPGFHEGSAWNYTFYVPHDVKGLAKLMGGQRKFIDKLQMVFDKGLYDPANEPDIAYPYLFSYFKGEEWRTQKTIADLLAKYYKATPDGIPGNEDCGTMSSWAIFSMMGFYPDCPGDPSYTITTPTFSKVTLHLDRHYYAHDLVIERQGNGQLIQQMTLGGKPLKSYRVSHDDLLSAGRLIIKTK